MKKRRQQQATLRLQKYAHRKVVAIEALAAALAGAKLLASFLPEQHGGRSETSDDRSAGVPTGLPLAQDHRPTRLIA